MSAVLRAKGLDATVLLLLLLVFAPSSTIQHSGYGRGVLCIDCSAAPANCITDYAKQTITCTVNTTSCGYKLCDKGDACFLYSAGAPSWEFSSACFHTPLLQNECIPEGNERTDASFPPPVGFNCQCNDIDECSLDKPVVYVHPSPAPGSTIHDVLSSPSLLPSPPHAGDRVYLILAIALLVLLLLLTVITMVGLLIAVLRKKAKQHRSLLQDSGATTFQHLPF